ncbi:MAG: DUF4037 domain-containing protein [Clostridia bacterium]|nr:DUF4037 domain-containing protein [Clostridia bacterium]
MKGLELSRKYYEEFGKPMLKEQFPEIEHLVAVGLVGSGSDCYGYDDDISHDHDFEPGFCLFLPDESVIDEKTFFNLERAYSKLPKEFYGYKRSLVKPVGGGRNGVFRTSDFYNKKIGSPNGELTVEQWFSLPDYALAEATNGEVFEDKLGEFTKIRNRLINMPQDIFLKKLAGNLLIMAQSGQYNYPRILKRGETASAQLSLFEFSNSAMKAYFLLNGKYMPYYKWQFRALMDLPKGEYLADSLEFLISTDNSTENANIKNEIINSVAEEIISILKEKEITKATCNDLEKHAYSVNDFIKNGDLRNSHILSGI